MVKWDNSLITLLADSKGQAGRWMTCLSIKDIIS